MIYYLEDCEEIPYELCKPYKVYLPQSRIAKEERYKFPRDKKLCILSYLLLAYALHTEYGIHTSQKQEFQYNKWGKPSLQAHPDISISISHCKKGIACAVAGSAVGIDIQEYVKYEPPVFDSVLASKEKELLTNTPFNEADKLFTKLWTVKESYVKYLGTGIGDGIHKMDFHSGITKERFDMMRLHFRLQMQDDYCMSSCSLEPDLSFIQVKLSDMLNRF